MQGRSPCPSRTYGRGRGRGSVPPSAARRHKLHRVRASTYFWWMLVRLTLEMELKGPCGDVTMPVQLELYALTLSRFASQRYGFFCWRYFCICQTIARRFVWFGVSCCFAYR